MTGDSVRVAGFDSLSLGQLEERLQLAMAFRQHLSNQGVVSCNDMRVAMESLGVELPTHAPLNSFTQVPSRTNFDVAVQFIRSREDELIDKVRLGVRRELIQTLEEIAGFIHKSDAEPFEPRHQMLAIVAQYLTGYEIPDNFTDPVAQKERLAIEEVMGEWARHNQLGQDVIGQDAPHQQALALWETVSRVISNQFVVECLDEETAILQALNAFDAGARAASHIEPEQLWSPNELVTRTLKFVESFTGPIPYKLQEVEPAVHATIRYVQEQEDTRTLQYLRVMALAIRNYLAWGWRMDGIRASAVDTAISVCRSAGHLRTMTA